MTVRNLALATTTWDLQIVNGNLSLISDNAAIVQAANSALRMVLGEWFLDATQGVPYPALFQKKNPSLALIKQTVTDTLLGVKGIVSVVTVDMRFVSTTRSLSVAWSATGSAGNLLTSQIGVF